MSSTPDWGIKMLRCGQKKEKKILKKVLHLAHNTIPIPLCGCIRTPGSGLSRPQIFSPSTHFDPAHCPSSNTPEMAPPPGLCTFYPLCLNPSSPHIPMTLALSCLHLTQMSSSSERLSLTTLNKTSKPPPLPAPCPISLHPLWEADLFL